MGLLHIAEMPEYVALLHRDAAEVRQLLKDLLINVTSFFRDAEAFDEVREKALAPLIQAPAPPARRRTPSTCPREWPRWPPSPTSPSANAGKNEAIPEEKRNDTGGFVSLHSPLRPVFLRRSLGDYRPGCAAGLVVVDSPTLKT